MEDEADALFKSCRSANHARAERSRRAALQDPLAFSVVFEGLIAMPFTQQPPLTEEPRFDGTSGGSATLTFVDRLLTRS